MAATVSAAMVSSVPAPFVATNAFAQQVSFSDVKATDYFFPAVQSLVSRNIIQGYSDGTFRPYENVTRAQAAKMLALALGLDTKNVEDPGFKDVAKSDWFYGPVAALVRAGVLKGYSDKTFKPYQTMTRAQMAKVLSLGFKLQETKNNKLPFTDVKSDDWFAGFVGALYENGITTGKTKNEFAPNEPVKRGQLAMFIYRAENLTGVTKTAKIEKITKDFIILSGKQYTFDSKLQNILNESNNEVLTNATISVETKGKQITAIKFLEITSSGLNENLVLDGQQGTIDGDVKVNGDRITLKNLVINGNLEVGKNVNNNFYVNNVEVKGKTTISDGVASQSLLYKSLTYQSPFSKTKEVQEVKTNVIFENSILNQVELHKQNAVVEVKGTTSIKEVVVASNGTITASSSSAQVSKLLIGSGVTSVQLNGSFTEVAIQATGNLTLDGSVSIKNLKIQSMTTLVLNTSGKIEQLSIDNEKAQITLQSNVKIGNVVTASGINVSNVIKNFDAVKSQIEKVNGNVVNGNEVPSGGGSSGGSGGSSGSGGSTGSNGSTNNSNNGSTTNNSQVPSNINQAGTYGPNSGQSTINGDVTINSSDVTLQNVTITGNLILGEGIGEGDVTLKGVTVQGKTEVRGGGNHSIHFQNSVLMTVIVNKNNGSVRIVAEGSTRVVDLQLESYAIVEEKGLTGDAPGFTNVQLAETIQSTDSGLSVRLVGNFETVNSRAARVQIDLSEETNIETLVLSAIATITGAGRIDTAHINASGVTLSQRPENLVLQIPEGGSVRIGQDEINESYSSAQQTAIQGIKATQGVIDVTLEKYVAGLTVDDFKVTAKMGDRDIELQNLKYDPAKQRITYEPIPLNSDNIGKEVEITVAPAASTNKVTGEAQTTKVTLQTGFEGYIKDIYGVGIEGLTIKFRKGSNTRDGEVVKEVKTDKYGYYSVALEPGTYTGEISGSGFVTSYIFAVAPDNLYNVNQNETAIRAAATGEVKIMLTWNERPYDIDSHLVGPTPNDGTRFHTWYGNKEYEYNNMTYVDLDWDDTDSYGPETTTIRKLVDGTYTFIVHNYSGEHGEDLLLRQSGAKVQIFKGGSTSPDQTFEIPAGEGDELYWTVFEMVVSDNGTKIQIHPINTLSKTVPAEVRVDTVRTELTQAVGYINDQLDVFKQYVNAQQLQPLTDAVAAAESALVSDQISGEELQQVLFQLQESLDQFFTIKTQLAMIVEYAHSQLEVFRQGHTEEQLQSLTEAIAAADAALTSQQTSEEEFQQLLTQLEDALGDFENVRSKLQRILDYARLQLIVLRAHYDQDQLQPLTDAISTAERVLSDEEASDEELLAALHQLIQASEQLDQPPQLELLGGEVQYYTVGDNYVERGYSAMDNEDGDVNVAVSGTVDTSKQGEYTVTYTATDSAGHETVKTRTVIVQSVEDLSSALDDVKFDVTENGSLSALEVTLKEKINSLVAYSELQTPSGESYQLTWDEENGIIQDETTSDLVNTTPLTDTEDGNGQVVRLDLSAFLVTEEEYNNTPIHLTVTTVSGETYGFDITRDLLERFVEIHPPKIMSLAQQSDDVWEDGIINATEDDGNHSLDVSLPFDVMAGDVVEILAGDKVIATYDVSENDIRTVVSVSIAAEELQDLTKENTSYNLTARIVRGTNREVVSALSQSWTVLFSDTVPNTTITNATYHPDTNALILTGTNFDQLVAQGQTDIKNQLDFTKLTFTDSQGQSVPELSIANIATAIVEDEQTLKITFTNEYAQAFENVILATDDLVAGDALEILAGFTRNAALNASTMDQLAKNSLME